MPCAEIATDRGVHRALARIFVTTITGSGNSLPPRPMRRGSAVPQSRLRVARMPSIDARVAELERTRCASVGAVLATYLAAMKILSIFRRAIPWLALSVLVTPAFAQTDASIQSLDAIRAAAQKFVIQRVPKQEPGAVTVNVGALDPRLRLAPCATPLKVSLPAGATFRDRMTVAVSCSGDSSWTVYVPIAIETQSPVLVLRRPANRGTRLTSDDVEIQTRVVAGTGASYLTDVAQLSGRTLKRPLGAGAALTMDAMMDDMVVKRGQHVTLLAAVGGLEVRAAGVAMNDAAAQSRVRVQNISSNRIVEGVVESPDVIRITP
jgi:flagella basal body P-ring formation protein FlgA